MFYLLPLFTIPGKVALHPLWCGLCWCKNEGFVHYSNIQNSLQDTASTERVQSSIADQQQIAMQPSTD